MINKVKTAVELFPDPFSLKISDYILKVKDINENDKNCIL